MRLDKHPGAALGLIAILTAGVARATGETAAAVVSLLCAADSLVVGWIALECPESGLEDYIVVGIDAAAG